MPLIWTAVGEQQEGTPSASVAGTHEGERGATADNKRFGKQSNGKKNHLCLSFAIQLLDTHIDFDV